MADPVRLPSWFLQVPVPTVLCSACPPGPLPTDPAGSGLEDRGTHAWSSWRLWGGWGEKWPRVGTACARPGQRPPGPVTGGREGCTQGRLCCAPCVMLKTRKNSPFHTHCANVRTRNVVTFSQNLSHGNCYRRCRPDGGKDRHRHKAGLISEPKKAWEPQHSHTESSGREWGWKTTSSLEKSLLTVLISACSFVFWETLTLVAPLKGDLPEERDQDGPCVLPSGGGAALAASLVSALPPSPCTPTH